jgi:hypothetical protein
LYAGGWLVQASGRWGGAERLEYQPTPGGLGVSIRGYGLSASGARLRAMMAELCEQVPLANGGVRCTPLQEVRRSPFRALYAYSFHRSTLALPPEISDSLTSFDRTIFRNTPSSTHPAGKRTAPASHLDGRRGREALSGTHSSIFSLRAGPDEYDKCVF